MSHENLSSVSYFTILSCYEFQEAKCFGGQNFQAVSQIFGRSTEIFSDKASFENRDDIGLILKRCTKKNNFRARTEFYL